MPYRLIANLLTSLNLLFGFFSILFSIKENFIFSGWLILFAIFLDIVKRRISDFSKREFDLLSDFTSFGLAPLILVYKNFEQFFLWWIFVLFLYLVCSAIRLARFNTSSYFKGLPLTVSAGLVASTIILVKRYNIDLKMQVLAVLIIILSILMVSNMRYPSFKDLKNKRLILFLIIGLILLNILGESLVWFLFFGYIVVSPFLIKFNLFDKIRPKPR